MLERKEAKAQAKKPDILAGSFPRERALKLGDKGWIAEGFVLQIVNDNLALVDYTHIEPRGYEWAHVSEKVFVMCDTTKMVDGKSWDSKQRFEVARTMRYDTVGGSSKQIWVLEPIE